MHFYGILKSSICLGLYLNLLNLFLRSMFLIWETPLMLKREFPKLAWDYVVIVTRVAGTYPYPCFRCSPLFCLRETWPQVCFNSSRWAEEPFRLLQWSPKVHCNSFEYSAIPVLVINFSGLWPLTTTSAFYIFRRAKYSWFRYNKFWSIWCKLSF